MEQMNEMLQTLDEMVSCGRDLSAAARELYSAGELLTRLAEELKGGLAGEGGSGQAPSCRDYPEPLAAPANDPAPSSRDEAGLAKEVTKEDVRRVFAAKRSEVSLEELRRLLSKYGAENVSGLDPKDYAAIIAEAEVLGHAG